MEVNSEMKEVAPPGAKSFLLRVDPYSKRFHNPGKQTGSHKAYSPSKNDGKAKRRLSRNLKVPCHVY